MKSPEDQDAKRNTRRKEINHKLSATSSGVPEQASLKRASKTDGTLMSVNRDGLTDSEESGLRWELEKHLENFRFFLDLGIKAVGLFYAIVGGILSIYFAKASGRNDEVMKVLLWVPFLISVILGVIFLIGAKLMRDATVKLNDISRSLRMRKPSDFSLLTWLLLIFGTSFFVTGASLIWLYYRLA